MLLNVARVVSKRKNTTCTLHRSNKNTLLCYLSELVYYTLLLCCSCFSWSLFLFCFFLLKYLCLEMLLNLARVGSKWKMQQARCTEATEILNSVICVSLYVTHCCCADLAWAGPSICVCVFVCLKWCWDQFQSGGFPMSDIPTYTPWAYFISTVSGCFCIPKTHLYIHFTWYVIREWFVIFIEFMSVDYYI